MLARTVVRILTEVFSGVLVHEFHFHVVQSTRSQIVSRDVCT
ncbi:morphogeneis protein [Salmonella phage 39]|nr:morphogeneis protein [Salmonella phage 39]